MSNTPGMDRERLIGRTSPPPPHSREIPANTTTAAGDSPEPPSKKPDVKWSNLPNKPQLLLLALCRLSEPLSNVCLLPYIFHLVRSVLPSDPSNSSTPSGPSDPATTADAARISQSSGLLIAAFPLAQFLLSLPISHLSDRHGRRAPILLGLLLSAISNAAFGFSKSLPTLFLWRALAGVANSNVGLMRSMTAEIVREKRYQTKAFLLLPLVFNSGMVGSLALGGLLADPVRNLPWAFGEKGFLNWSGREGGAGWAVEFPYALPGLLNAGVLGATLVVSWLFLKETLPGKEGRMDFGLRVGELVIRLGRKMCNSRNRSEYMPVADEETQPPCASTPSSPTATADLEETQPTEPLPEKRPPRLPFRKVFTSKVLTATAAFGLLPLHNSSFMHIFPIYLSTPPAPNPHPTLFSFSGGLGLRPYAIGLWLAVFGVMGILLQMFIYPRLQARIGTLGILRLALVIFPIVYAATPYLSLAQRVARWAGLALIICGQIAARTMAIPSTVILLTEAAPDRSVLGTVHGAGNMLASLARAVGPAVGGAVFAWGVESGMIGAVWWVYLVSVALVALVWGFALQREE